jgi:hypothetical protein
MLDTFVGNIKNLPKEHEQSPIGRIWSPWLDARIALFFFGFRQFSIFAFDSSFATVLASQ